MKLGRLRSAVLAGALLLAPSTARAQFDYFDTEAVFLAATQTTLATDFEDGPTGTVGYSLTRGGVAIQSIGGQAYIAWAGHGFFDPLPTSNVLTASGGEWFRMSFASTGPTAFGFNFLSNRYSPAQFTIYDVFGQVLATHTLTQNHNSYGFFGFTSNQAVGFVDLRTYGGEIENTAIDNLRLGTPVAPTEVVPEPVTLLLVGSGLAGVAGAARRRRRQEAVPA